MRYGEFPYGAQQGIYLYGDSAESHERVDPEPDGYVDLEKYIPAFIANMKEFHAWYVSQGYEVGREWDLIRTIFRQLFIETIDTDWGCTLWEKEVGIIPVGDATIDQRKSAIRSAWISKQTCTPALVKKITEDLTGVECNVIEDFPNYKFIIQFIGQYGIVRNSKTLSRQLEEIKPAHLLYELEYKYVIWKELLPYTWNQLSAYTWNGLRVWGQITRVTWHGLYNALFTWKSVSNNNWITIKNIEEAKE